MQKLGRSGGFTPAEGCMFGAVLLFVVLLLGILYIAFMRFRNPPPPTMPSPSATAMWTALTGFDARHADGPEPFRG